MTENSDNRTVEQLIEQVEAQKMRVKVEQQQLERHEDALHARLEELGLVMMYKEPEPSKNRVKYLHGEVSLKDLKESMRGCDNLEDRLDNLLKKANFEN